MARIKPGVPTVKEIREGESEYRYIHGTGLVLYTRYSNQIYSTKMHAAPTPPVMDKKLETAIGDLNNSSTSLNFDEQIVYWLENNTSYIQFILNKISPRTFSFPFYLQAYEIASTLTLNTAYIIPGINGSSLMGDIIDGDADGYDDTLLRNLVPFKCSPKKILCVSNHAGSATDMATARLGFAMDGLTSPTGSDIGSFSASAIAPTITNGLYNYWNFTDFTSISIPSDAEWSMIPNYSTNPSTNKFQTISGIITFEEVL